MPALKFHEGIKSLLEELYNKNIKFAVLSSNSHKNISEFFKLNEISISDIYCSSNIFGKDMVLKKFLMAKKLQPSDIIYVGDEARDVIACRKLGIKIAWVKWGYDAIEALQDTPPDFIINDTEELLSLLLKLQPST